MVRITVNADCRNSPKKLFLKEFNIAFAEGDVTLIAERVSDDITWNIIRDKKFQGKPAFIEALKRMKDNITSELEISTIITHGNEGAVNGEIQMQSGKNYAYCDVYEFSSAKGTRIKSITSYVIEINND